MPKSKHRYFAVILYPESLPHGWKDKLESLGRPVAISPLHNLDKVENPVPGGSEFKKPHYHVLFIEPNPLTTDAIRKKFQRALGLKAVNHVEVVDNVENYYAYLTHHSKDAIKKHKHEYDVNAIVKLNDFDVDRYVTMDQADKQGVVGDVIRIIKRERLSTIIEVEDYIEAHEHEEGAMSMATFQRACKGETGWIRLHLDGVYQLQRREREMREYDR